MRSRDGLEIDIVRPGSSAEKAGLHTGDILLQVNGRDLSDSIDFMFHGNEPELDILLLRKGKKIPVKVSAGEGVDIGIELKPFRIKQCNNKCIFCFVAQLPKGLRKSLYVRDEDYRASFLYGNYIALTNLTVKDKKRIIEQRLSPLYLSVHSTTKAVRNTMIGNQKAVDVMKDLKFFKENRIRMHTQVVLCPGYNDGKNLQKTIRDLYGLYPYVSSVAVVAVGRTMHRKTPLKPVEKEDAIKAIEIIESFQRRFRKKRGDSIVYGSDELYIKADMGFPALKDYGEMPQIENGVGLVSLFNSRAKKISNQLSALGSQQKRKKYITFTGTSFYPYLKKFSERLFEKEHMSVDVVPIENNFFGKSVTVTGLITGRDVIRTLSDRTEGYESLLIPDIVLREGEGVFLDDISVKEIGNALKVKVKVIESTPEGLINGMETISESKR